MKLLVDPIYTADLDNCSCAYKSKQIVEHIGDKHHDAFFYWLVPPADSGNFQWDKDWFPHPDKVKLIEVPSFRDRIRQYSNLHPERMALFSPYGPQWDWDFAITAHTPQVPLLQMASHRWGAPYEDLHRFIVYDGFPLFSFKDSIPNANYESTELTGYMRADRGFLFSFWERVEILKRARHYLTPSQVLELTDKLRDALPHKAWTVKPKSKAQIAEVVERKRPFCIGYTQRIERERRRTDEVFGVFEKLWIMHDSKLRFVTSSATMRAPVPIPEFVERKKLPRKEFHALLENEIDCTLVFSTDEGYPLSVVEPLVHGVPGVIYRAKYAEAVLGEDYPFYFTKTAEAYALLDAFRCDYAGMYAKFEHWLTNRFQTLINERAPTYLPESIDDAISEFLGRAHERLGTDTLRMNDVNLQLRGVYDQIKRKDGSFTVRDFFHAVHDTGYFSILSKEDLDWDGHDGKGQLSRVFQRQLYRRTLMRHYGCTDASPETGHLTAPDWSIAPTSDPSATPEPVTG